MSNWDSLLVKTGLSGALVEECLSHVAECSRVGFSKALHSTIASAGDLKLLRTCVGRLKADLPEELVEQLAEEVREIASDLKWAKSKRGAYVRKVSSWVEDFHAEFRSIARFSDVMVGSHASRPVIFVTGKVDSDKDFAELMSYLQSKRPPFKILTDLLLRGGQGGSP